jgi:hypothetical protein
MPLNPNNVPEALRKLIPIAERWGISDDFEREAALESAFPEDLELLIHSIDAVSDEDLFGWLAGQESFSLQPSEEYIALTCLTIAIDSAKIKRVRREK